MKRYINVVVINNFFFKIIVLFYVCMYLYIHMYVHTYLHIPVYKNISNIFRLFFIDLGSFFALDLSTGLDLYFR